MRLTIPGTEKKQTSSEEGEHAGSKTVSREILFVNRDPELRAVVTKALYVGNLSSTLVSSEAEAFACLRKTPYGLLVLGIDSNESIALLGRVRQGFPALPIVGVARTASPEIVRDVLRAGATDFVFGSIDSRTFGPRLVAILEGRVEVPAAEPKAAPERDTGPGTMIEVARADAAVREDLNFICRNKKMMRILEIADTIAATESTVLVQGESGTGKELIAKRIHYLSKRGDKPFVEVNCGALPETLLESQLFGHEKGSFTGAVHRQVGLFEIADQGTIFLDEIGEMSLDMQVKLLRVLQFREFRRIGGSQVVKVDVRVVAATNKDLKAEVEKKHFRADLFYRLNVIALEVPPLRERLEEIPELIEFFCERFAREKNVSRKTFTPEAVQKMQKCRWTGNVRELENAVERSLLLSKESVVTADELDEYLGESGDLGVESKFEPTLTLDEVKRIHIAKVLRENGGNKMRTARTLKINVKTLYNLIRKLDIHDVV
jgi:two-component system response regulator HydG